ncbi:P-loop containing nucleoside triphosphate hydrolase protein [Exidia glandulosa HHB12029]|uniref:p-loop containing nucleoside triphosphate hydrolase protein n=1 Tax=Exidia glandulosa HHB12029 TaxID=1314781 RepID=A0A165EB76_EXIGL|nr:P-loop containing nucleoside triphosphate hydrolase protein [Exidia glandulosa HHB12029]
MSTIAPTTRVLRKRTAPAPTTPSKTRSGRPAKRVKVVHSDTESESSSDSDGDASDYDDERDDKENVPAPTTPRSQRAVARRKAEPAAKSTPRRRVLSTGAKSTPTKSVSAPDATSPTKGAAKKMASLTLTNSTNAPDSDSSMSSDDSNPFISTPDTSLELDAPPSSPIKKRQQRDMTPFTRARAALRADQSSTPLTGRDNERRELLAYLRGSSPKSLYISGTPGTGKTALIREVLTAYPYPSTSDAEEEEEEDVRKVYVNCVGRKEEHVWDLILDSLHASSRPASPSKNKKKDDSRSTFERFLSTLTPGTKCFLVLDEIDHLSPSSGVLAAVFALPASHADVLRVVAISNSHTLAARSAHVATLHFAPYDAKAMGVIARARLGDVGVFHSAAITVAAARTAGVTGDVRALVALLLRCLDGEEKEQVGPKDVLEAFKSLQLKAPSKPSQSASTTRTGPAAGLALQPKLALLALFIAKKRSAAGLGMGLMPSSSSFFLSSGPSSPTKRSPFQRAASFSPSKKRTLGMSRSASFNSSCGGGDANALHAFYTAIVSRSSPLSSVSRTEFVDVLAVLEGCGALSTAHGFEVAEGVRVEDVLACDGAEEGILTALWEKEVRRCERELEERAGGAMDMDEA